MKDIINEKMKIESMKHITKKTGLATLKDPEFFYVPLSQHIGQVAKETVSKGDYVHRYEKIGEVTDVMDTAAHNILIIEDIVSKKEVMIPLVDEFVKKIDFKIKM